jgi:hypothetical protein
MHAIPFRKSGSSRLPVGYRIVCFVLPLGLMFGSFLPIWFLAMALARALGIPDHAPVREQPFGLVWLALFLTMIPVFFAAGMVFGFLMNAMILRFGLGLPWSAIRETGVCPDWLVDSLVGWRASATGSKERERHEDPMYDPQLDDVTRRLRPWQDSGDPSPG